VAIHCEVLNISQAYRPPRTATGTAFGHAEVVRTKILRKSWNPNTDIWDGPEEGTARYWKISRTKRRISKKEKG
jgi:hypothetical protein